MKKSNAQSNSDGALRISRRVAIGLPAVAAETVRRAAAAWRKPIPVLQQVEISLNSPNSRLLFPRPEFGTVGVYDVDWLLQPRFAALLDNLAASPGAFHGVRFFGCFTAGALEDLAPAGGGVVWADASKPIDFSIPLNAIAALTSRGLVPFVSLGFFPSAVSPSPIAPPATWDAWKTLVTAFFAALIADSRFGAEAIAGWRFEVWNEPDEGRFWSGSIDDYFALYRATSDAVREVGVKIVLAGPAIAYKPEVVPPEGPTWIARFLDFLAANPDVQCDCLSYHRKGTVTADPPDPRRLYSAGTEIAGQVLARGSLRHRNLTLINDEADEKVGFEVPYPPRMDQRNASWLAASAAIHVQLGRDYARSGGLQFVAAADNADLQLVQAPFDGRRSIMTRTPLDVTDLLKIPAYGFYEMLRFLGDVALTPTNGAEQLFPTTDIYHLAATGPAGVAALLTWYPRPGASWVDSRTLRYVVRDVPWSSVNIARFQIDSLRSNSYAAAGGSSSNPVPAIAAADIPKIRQTQELALFEPPQFGVPIRDELVDFEITLEPYTTIALWVSPDDGAKPDEPQDITARTENGNVTLSWSAGDEMALLSYEVYLLEHGMAPKRISPYPLLSARWIDTAPPAGTRQYAVRTISASGLASRFAFASPVEVPPSAT